MNNSLMHQGDQPKKRDKVLIKKNREQFLPAVGDNTARQTDQWEIEERGEIQLFCFLFHYALQIHGRFEECELTGKLRGSSS